MGKRRVSAASACRFPISWGSCPEGTEGVVFIWTHFGGNLVSPKWIIEHERDIWVVKCPFSSKTDRVATQQSCALDYPDVARTISFAVWWAGRITKTRLDKTI
jgi:hypothetical protein